MPEVLCHTGRDFLVARYTAAHQQLLLRSDKGDGGPTRMEILFGPVTFMSLSCNRYDNLTLYRLDSDEFLTAAGGAFELNLNGANFFGLGNGRIQGVIAAGSYIAAEDDKDYWEPSGILRFD
ncbi:hypothetical protein P8605_02440 [Streptomyces sp. T-3]|nr:hypothetical protein [Streptomyces sp. T-3]